MFGVWDLGFRVWGLGFRVSGFRVLTTFVTLQNPKPQKLKLKTLSRKAAYRPLSTENPHTPKFL